MSQVAVTRHFNAPPDKVWNVLSDLERAAERIEAIKHVEILTDGPVGQGTRFKETRVMFGKEATEEMEITEWNPPTHLAMECETCGMHARSVISCRPDGEGTRVEMSMQTTPLTFVAKLMSPLGKMMEKSCRKAFEKDLDDVQRIVEDQTQQSTPPQPA